MSPAAVIFDVDGVLVYTDRLQERAWREVARREGLPFPEGLADRLRGVSRARSLELLLGEAYGSFSPEHRASLMEYKNRVFLDAARGLTPADSIPGVRALLLVLGGAGVRLAAASASRNARLVLDRVGLSPLLHAIVDGHDAPRAKPDPQVFMLAAEKLHVEPARCVVVEDALSGVEAAVHAGMAVVGVGPARHDPRALAGLVELFRDRVPRACWPAVDPWN